MERKRQEGILLINIFTNEKLNDRPYPQIIKPVYDRTLSLFTELKKLNTSIRKYIDRLTAGLSPEEIMELNNISVNAQSSIRIIGSKNLYFDAFQIKNEAHDALKENISINCDVALVPVGGGYTMDKEQAAEFTAKMSPKAAIPKHYGCGVGMPEDGKDFKNLVKELNSEIQVELKLGLS